MKKIIFSAAVALLAVTGTQAQKQEGGEHNLEVQFAPLGGSPVSVSGIRFRHFMDETMAVRASLIWNGSKSTTVNSQEFISPIDNKTVIPALYDVETSRTLGLSVGVEKHFAGTDRLSPYAGVQVFFAGGKETLTRDFHGATNAGDTPDKFSTWNIERVNKTSTLGAGLIFGTDFYFADHFYLGAELGLGMQSMKTKDVETTVSNTNAYILDPTAQADSDFSQAHVAVAQNGSQSVEYSTIVGDGNGNYKDFSFGVTFQPTLRLGWLFN